VRTRTSDPQSEFDGKIFTLPVVYLSDIAKDYGMFVQNTVVNNL